MSGIISARAWGKVWAYRSTFLLGLLNTVETAFLRSCYRWPWV